MDKKAEYVLSLLGVLIPIIKWTINGFVLLKLWKWFIVSKFSLPELSLFHAMGIILMVYLLTGEGNEDSRRQRLHDEYDKKIENLASWKDYIKIKLNLISDSIIIPVFMYPLLILLFGWLLSLVV